MFGDLEEFKEARVWSGLHPLRKWDHFRIGYLNASCLDGGKNEGKLKL